ncbi:MAG: hypothetical protein KF729_11830 [Sandaracinaceae bacterium]|nr:hypothetical protein [Sandaracinaceae bacterium]
MSGQTSWVRRAERALETGTAADGDTRVVVVRPPLLDADGAKAVLAPVLAAIAWAAAVFREVVAESSLDPIGMLLRFVALGLTLRVILLGAVFAGRVRTWLTTSRHGLVLTSEGLLYRTPTHDVVVPRERVVGIAERGQWQTRKAGRRWSEVFVVVDPALGRTHVALPPVFDDTPGRLAERLMRWRGSAPEPREAEAEPASLASRVYDAAAAGLAEPGTTVVRHDLGWLKKGPYALLLVATVALDGLSRGGAAVWGALEPWMIAGLFLALLAVPGRWLWMTRREVSPRKGLAMVLTPAEVLIRTRQGILRARWKELVGVTVDAKTKWSVLEGAHEARQLVLTRKHAPAIRYDEPYLGLPVEVGKLLLDAYRSGWLPREEPAAPPRAASDEEQ